MGFEVAADAYGTFMGRYSEPLAVLFADACAPVPGERALDVGCGPGALTAVLAERLGPTHVAAVDPSASFVGALRARLPEVDTRQASAGALPFGAGSFDLVAAQLVVHFMADPVAGLIELARVTRPGGRVAACVWDFAGGRAPLSSFWRAVRELDPSADDESRRPGAAPGALAVLFGQAGLEVEVDTELSVQQSFPDFDAWWATLAHGVGPVGDHLATLDAAGVATLRAHSASLAPAGAFDVDATAWTVVARRGVTADTADPRARRS